VADRAPGDDTVAEGATGRIETVTHSPDRGEDPILPVEDDGPVASLRESVRVAAYVHDRCIWEPSREAQSHLVHGGHRDPGVARGAAHDADDVVHVVIGGRERSEEAIRP